MKRKILIIIILLAIISSFIVIASRYKTENSVKGVELILDYDSLNLLDVEETEYLKNLKENGLTAIAVYPDRIKDLVNRGEAKLITGSELMRYSLITGEINPLLSNFPYTEDSAFLIIDNNRYIRELGEWAREYKLQYQLEEGQTVVFFPEWETEYLDLSPGFNKEVLANIQENNLKIVPRFYNSKIANSYYQELLAEISPELLIFAGSEVTGYQEDSNMELKKTAELMLDNNIIFGMIEPFIARQKGAESLAYLLDYNLLRVHSIQQQEMDERANYTVDKIIERYLRAVRERNVRLLYLKPFLKDKDGQSASERTLSYINSLSEELKEAGYNPGSLETYRKYKSPSIFLILTGLGIVAGGLILLDYLLPVKYSKFYFPLLAIVLLAQLGLLLIGREIFLRKILALGSGIIFPSLAIVSQLMDNGDELRSRANLNYFYKFLKTCLISLLGAVFIAAALAHISFVLYIDQFTGVKLSFILPILFISIYFLQDYLKESNTNLLNITIAFLEKKIKVKHLVLVSVLAIGGLIYIGRTGNNFIIPVPDLELVFRDLLEKILYIRPRFKEFLIGHPFLVLAIGLRGRLKKSLYFYPLIILASIGQINILNTFSHIHTPFVVSMIRTFHGIWTGLIVGFILLAIVRYLFALFDRKRGDYHG